jgi:PAS domain-containing protein
MSTIETSSTPSHGIRPTPGSGTLPYLWAVGAVGAGVAIRSLIGPWIGEALPFVTLYPAVFVAAVLGGLGPGVLATVLSAVAALHLYIDPAHSLALTDAVAKFGVALFTGSGLATAWLGEARLRAERQVHSALQQAETAAAYAQEEALRAEEEAARAEEEQLIAEEQSVRADVQAARAADALARLERTLASINEGFMVLDPNFVITYMNQQAAVLGGGTQPQDFVGRTHWEAFPESYHTTFGRAYRLAMTEQRVVRVAGEYAPLQRSFQVTVYPGEMRSP